MNRRSLVISGTMLVLAVFAVAAVLQSRRNADAPSSKKSTASVGATQAGGRAAPYVREHSPVMGPANAPVTIVEFFDPACESCRAFYPIVKKILDDHPGKVRLVLRYAAFHKQSRQAVEALEAARLQDKFQPAVEALLQYQPAWAPHGREGIGFWGFLATAGIDVARAQKDMQAPAIADVIRIDEDDIRALGVRGTPTFFVNGKSLEKFGVQQLLDLVKAEVEASK